MNYFKAKSYTEVKDKRYIIYPDEKLSLRECTEPKLLGTQYQTFSDTKIIETKKLIKLKITI